MKKINSPLRVCEVGGNSYWPSNMDAAKQMIGVIISRNGCGVLETRQPDGTWKLTHRFEPHTGIVADMDTDFGLTPERLETKYGQTHPTYDREDWKLDVDNNDTKLGYWDWVIHNVESPYYDSCEKCSEGERDKVFVADVGFICKSCAEKPDEADVAE